MKNIKSLILIMLLPVLIEAQVSCSGIVTGVNNSFFEVPFGELSNRCNYDNLDLFFDLSTLNPTNMDVEMEVKVRFLIPLIQLDAVLLNNVNIPFLTQPVSNIEEEAIISFSIPSGITAPQVDNIRFGFEVNGEITGSGDRFQVFVTNLTAGTLCQVQTFHAYPAVQPVQNWFDFVITPPNTRLSQNMIQSTISHLLIEETLIVDQDLKLLGLNGAGSPYNQLSIEENGEVIIEGGNQLEIVNNISVESCGTPWRSITVQNGGVLTIENNPILREGTEAIIVESGGTLIINNASFINCETGIIIEEGANVEIVNTRFFGNGIGINFTGDPNSLVLRNNRFEGCAIGILAENTENITIGSPGLNNQNLFIGNKIGIEFDNGAGTIVNNFFNQTNINSILIEDDSDVTITENSIDFQQTGILGIESDLLVYENEIGALGGGSIGILTFLCTGEVENNKIDADNSAVQSSLSRMDYHENFVGLKSNPTAGFDLLSSGDQIRDNIIYATNTGISANAFDSEISSNDIVVNRNGIVLSGGSTTAFVDNNVISTSDGDGIIIRNSGMNELECNDILASDDGISVMPGSSHQLLLSNYLSSGDNDVVVRSTIGVQEHHGNIFEGERISARGSASAMDSRFIIDSDDPNFEDLNPDDSDPSELKEIVPAGGNVTVECSGVAGSPLGINFFDPEFFCDVIEYIRIRNANDLNQMIIEALHILRYLELRFPGAVFPDCVKKLVEELPCDVQVFIQKEVELKLMLSGNQSGGEGQGLNLMNQVQQQKVEVTALQGDCENELVNIWKQSYLFLLKHVSGDSLLPQEIATLDNIAKKCTHKWGDPVDWARAIVHQYTQTDYSAYDNCIDDVALKSIKNPETQKPIGLIIAPNPTRDFINISLETPAKCDLIMSNITGQIIYSSSFEGRYYSIDVAELDKGLYFVKLDLDNGDQIVKKVLVN